MAEAKNSGGMIAVDKMGGKVLFLNPSTYETEVVIDGFPRTVHELLVIPETGLAYVPIFGDRGLAIGHHRFAGEFPGIDEEARPALPGNRRSIVRVAFAIHARAQADFAQ